MGHRRSILLALALSCSGPIAAHAAERIVRATITHRASDGVFLDRGLEDGLTRELVGSVRRGADEVGRVRIERLAAKSSFAGFLAGADRIAVGDVVELAIPETAPPPPTTASEPPLLAPLETAGSSDHDLLAGAVGFRTSYLRDSERDQSFVYSRLFTRGTLDRIGGERWSLEWNLDANRRDGNGYDGHPDFQEVQGRVDLLQLAYHGEETRFAIGRIDPLVLPSIGPLDGVQLEQSLSEHWSAGVLTGLRPDRRTLAFRAQEWALIPYTGFEVGEREATQSITAAGVEVSSFDGQLDRQALHLDELVTFGKTLRLHVTSEVDLYGSNDQRSGVGLTKLGAIADLWPQDALSFYARAHHFERPDTLAERDLVASDALFDAGHHVFAVGSRQRADAGWSFFEELGYIDGAHVDGDYQVRAGLSKSGVLGVDELTAGGEAFNTVGLDQKGIGGRVFTRWAPIPELDLGLALDSSRIDYEADDPTTLQSSAMTLDAFWALGQSVSLDWAWVHFFGDGLSGDSIDLGVTVRF